MSPQIREACKEVLATEISAAMPYIHTLCQEALALDEENSRLRKQLENALLLVNAVESSEFSGIWCNDVNGQNWFDLRSDFHFWMKGFTN